MKKTLLLFLLLIACAPDELTQEQATYREKCLADGNPWMLMSQVQDGQVVGPSCHGCMPDERHHICTLAEYDKFKSAGEAIGELQ